MLLFCVEIAAVSGNSAILRIFAWSESNTLFLSEPRARSAFLSFAVALPTASLAVASSLSKFSKYFSHFPRLSAFWVLSFSVALRSAALAVACCSFRMAMLLLLSNLSKAFRAAR